MIFFFWVNKGWIFLRFNRGCNGFIGKRLASNDLLLLSIWPWTTVYIFLFFFSGSRRWPYVTNSERVKVIIFITLRPLLLFWCRTAKTAIMFIRSSKYTILWARVLKITKSKRKILPIQFLAHNIIGRHLRMCNSNDYKKFNESIII